MQAESLEDADRRIDNLAATGRLDPALMLTLAKAYAKAKETDVTKEEVKDIMVHLYMQVALACTCWLLRPLACCRTSFSLLAFFEAT